MRLLVIASRAGRRERGRRGTGVADARTSASVSGSYYLPQFVFREFSEGFLAEDELFHFGNTSGGKL